MALAVIVAKPKAATPSSIIIAPSNLKKNPKATATANNTAPIIPYFFIELFPPLLL